MAVWRLVRLCPALEANQSEEKERDRERGESEKEEREIEEEAGEERELRCGSFVTINNDLANQSIQSPGEAASSLDWGGSWVLADDSKQTHWPPKG